MLAENWCGGNRVHACICWIAPASNNKPAVCGKLFLRMSRRIKKSSVSWQRSAQPWGALRNEADKGREVQRGISNVSLRLNVQTWKAKKFILALLHLPITATTMNSYPFTKQFQRNCLTILVVGAAVLSKTRSSLRVWESFVTSLQVTAFESLRLMSQTSWSNNDHALVIKYLKMCSSTALVSNVFTVSLQSDRNRPPEANRALFIFLFNAEAVFPAAFWIFL